MRFIEILARGIRRFSFIRIPSQKFLKRLVLNTRGRNFLNSLYSYMNYKEREIFHSLYAKIFKDSESINLSTTWKVNFVNSNIEIPMDGDSIWLHWDTAISIVGHDIEIKQFYEKLLKSDHRPTCFFDIGANYGTHSILLLANDINSITFEPNPQCKKYFSQIAQQNNLDYNLQNVAVSDKSGNVNLMFPEKDTWLGSISEDYQSNFKNFDDVINVEVPAITLDQYVQENNLIPDLIKIDTEGFEIHVLRGGIETIQQSKPNIIFECNDKSKRADLFQLFNSLNYVIRDLLCLKEPLNNDSFLYSESNNFLAIGKNHELNNEIKNFA